MNRHLIGTTLSHFKITAKLGEGGMGEVYRAEDTKLGREVAIKVLPEEVASDAERLARFEREAKVLASLNHPHIAAIYQVEQSEDAYFLVMELAAGSNLSEHISRGPMALKDALPVAKQIATALEAAHQRGVVHRDLKPANIKVDSEGQVKVLDFGLAKALDPSIGEAASDSGSLSLSPTLTAQMTQAGMLLGTAAYMSPEQARGQEADKRTDIWAFGVVLWEMLTGKRLFEGATVSDTLAAVLRADHEWETLDTEVPRPLHRLLRRCLERDPKERLHDIADARLEVEEAMHPKAVGAGEESPHGGSPTAKSSVATWTAAVIGLLLGAALTWFGTGRMGSTHGSTEDSVRRFATSPPAETSIRARDRPILAISPDGSRIVVTGSRDERRHLYLRRLDQYEWTQLPGTEEARLPFFSPDGEWVAFFNDIDGTLEKISLGGGSPQVLCDAPNPWGGTWGPNGEIVFTPASPGGLMAVSELGGEPRLITQPDRSRGEDEHDWPQFLPDGKSIIYTIWKGSSATGSEIAHLDLDTGDIRILIAGSYGRITSSGHLIFARDDGIYVVGYDDKTGQIHGTPVPIPEPVYRFADYWIPFLDASTNGTLAYLPGRSNPERQLVTVDFDGSAMPVSEIRDGYMYPSISPDGRYVAVTVLTAGAGNIEIVDLATGRRSKLTREGGYQYPLWTRDGAHIIYYTDRPGEEAVIWQPLDGSSSAEVLIQSSPGTFVGFPYDTTPDGNRLAFALRHLDEDGGFLSDGIYLLDLVENHDLAPLLENDDNDQSIMGATFSPDGRWFAYVLNVGIDSEIVVQSTDGSGARHQISKTGEYSLKPQWSPDGRTIYYRVGDIGEAGGEQQSFVAVSVTTEPTFQAQTPSILFEDRFDWGAYLSMPNFSVIPDGTRFVTVSRDEDLGRADEIRVVTNWFAELERLAPTP